MICEHLRATGRFSGFGEPFNHELVIERSNEFGLDSMEDYLHWLMEDIRRPGTQFGMKASLDQVLMLLHSGAVPRYFSNCKWIFVQRVDVLSQAISLSIARQTNQWHSFEKSSDVEPSYDFGHIRHTVAEISDIYSNSLSLISMLGLNIYHLTYEQFLQDIEEETRRLAAYLGENEVSINPARLRLRKQGNAINQDFKSRFLNDFRKWSDRFL